MVTSMTTHTTPQVVPIVCAGHSPLCLIHCAVIIVWNMIAHPPPPHYTTPVQLLFQCDCVVPSPLFHVACPAHLLVAPVLCITANV